MSRRHVGHELAAGLLIVFGLAATTPAFPDTFTEALREGERLFNAGKYTEATLALARAAESRDSTTRKTACAYLGLCHQNMRSFDQAAAWYERALEKDADYLFVLENLGSIYLSNRSTIEKGKVLLERAEAQYSRDPLVYYNLACYHALAGKSGAASRYLDVALYNGYADTSYLASDPDFGMVREAAPFKRLFAHLDSVTAGRELLDRGDKKRQGSENDAALRFYQEAIRRYEEALGPDSLTCTRALNALAETNLAQANYGKSIEYFGKALAIQKSVLGEAHPDVASGCNSIGYACSFIGEYDQAIGYYQQALAIWRRARGDEHPDVATSYNNLGAVYDSKGEYDRAIGYYQQALAIQLKSVGAEHFVVAASYVNLGAAYNSKGEYDRAIGYFEKALAIQLKTLGEAHPDVASCYENLGKAYHSKGEYERAIGYHEKALAIRLKVLGAEHPAAAYSYNNLGYVYGLSGDYDRAIGYLEKALAIRQKVFGPEHPEVATICNNLGSAYYEKKEYDRAIGYFEKALRTFTRVLGEEHPNVAGVYNNLGSAYHFKGEYDRAVGYYEKALGIRLRTLGVEHADVSRNYNNLGSLYHSKGEYGKAAGYYDKALGIARRIGDRELVMLLSGNLGELYLTLKRYPEARKAFQEGIAVIEHARGETGAGKAEFTARNISLYYDSLFASAVMGDMAGVFEAAEAMRARGFLDRLSLSAALSAEGVPAQARIRMAALNDEIEGLAATRAAEIQKPESRQDKRKLLEIVSVLQAREKEFSELDQSLMGNSRYRELRKPVLATLAEAQQMAGADEAILEYMLWEKEEEQMAWCLLITRGGAELLLLEKDCTFLQWVAEFRQAILSGSPGREKLGALLYEKLIGPLEAKLAGMKKLLIVPDGALAFLPFDVLRKDGTGPYLCERFQVSLAPSVSVLKMVGGREYGSRAGQWLALGGALYSGGGSQARRGRRSAASEKALGEKAREYYAARGAGSYYDALGLGWENLPGTREEVLTIQQAVYGNKGTRVVLGEQASEKLVKQMSAEGELAKQRVVHFACHGRYDAEYPAYSAVVLSEVSGALKGISSEDGYLNVEEVALLRLKADLVTLSACETGLGKVVKGEGVIGLTRAFLVAGANRVGVTLWVVDDAATKEFMVRVYDLVQKKGVGWAEAMGRVKREFIRSGEYSDPYFWSPFVLYGR